MNRSLRVGLYTNSHKIANTVPLLKKGDISILDMVLDVTVKKRISWYFEKENLQFSFRTGKSTVDAVFMITRNVRVAFFFRMVTLIHSSSVI
jgi:hypothetical protein